MHGGGEGRRWRAGRLEVTQTQGTDATHNVNEGFFLFSLPKGAALLRTGGFLSHGNTKWGKNGPGFYFIFLSLTGIAGKQKP